MKSADLHHCLKIIKCFAKINLFGCSVSLRVFKIEHYFFLLIANQKIKRVTCLINLGKTNKKITAILKFKRLVKYLKILEFDLDINV